MISSHSLHETIYSLLREMAEKFILPRFRQLKQAEIHEKTGPQDLVTIADEETENALSPLLRNLIPGSVVLGEEAVSANPGLIREIVLTPPDDLWILDPLDGTRSFVEGRVESGMLLCLCKRGEPVAGWLYNFHTNQMIHVEKENGVYLNGQPAKPVTWDENWKMVVSKQLRELCNHEFTGDHYSYTRAAVVEYGQLIEGCYAEGLNALSYRIAKPWDHVAGTLMAQELGFRAARLNGDPYDWREIDRQGLLIAPPEKWEFLQNTLNFKNSNPQTPFENLIL